MRGKITTAVFKHHDIEAYGEAFLTVAVVKKDWPVALVTRPEESY
jgi:hypothetical protein